MLVCELFSLASFSTKICGLNVLPILPVKVGTANQIEFQLYSKPLKKKKRETQSLEWNQAKHHEKII
jgi:hypothetical protein